MGYLMDKFRWDYQTALMYVQSKRYCVSPNSVSGEQGKAHRSLRFSCENTELSSLHGMLTSEEMEWRSISVNGTATGAYHRLCH